MPLKKDFDNKPSDNNKKECFISENYSKEVEDHYIDDFEDDDDFEGWQGDYKLYSAEDWEGLVRLRYEAVINRPNDAYAQWRLGEAYLLNKEFDKAIEYLSLLHKKYPTFRDVQDSLLEVLFAVGKDENAVDWIEKPEVLHLDEATKDRCYNHLKKKRKPVNLDFLYIELMTQGYITFEQSQLMSYLAKDTRFVVKKDVRWYDCDVSLRKEQKK